MHRSAEAAFVMFLATETHLKHSIAAQLWLNLAVDGAQR